MHHTHIVKLLSILAILLLSVSCDNSKIDPLGLSVTPNTPITFAASGNDDITLAVTTEAQSWSYTAPEWIVGKKNDSSLIINATENNGAPREGNLIITAEGTNAVEIALYQEGYKATITLNNLMDTTDFDVTENVWNATFNAITTRPAIEDIALNIALDDKHLNFYNMETGKNCQLVPAEAITLSQDKVTIKQESTASDIINLSVDATSLKPGINYLIPIRATITSGDAKFTSRSNRINYLIKRIGERAIKQVVFIEVNDCNPLNLLQYNLTDGTPFFDAVILFAANINYNSEEDRVYLHNNPNVQALLDNSDTFLQPLRERGIKVYLGLLGNHDAAGLAQLSAWGAQQWAQEIADACLTYKLDGVNLDDEYSKNPIIDNKWFTTRSAAAGARLAYELKMAMAEKCSWPTEVSIYEFGALYNLPTVTIDNIEHTQSEFIDFVVSNYGSRGIPYGDLTYAHCSGASIELAQKRTLTESSAQTALDKGYGWCMWFGFDPASSGAKNNREHSMAQFNVAADVFYSSEVVPPTHVYKKIGEGNYDAQPYPIQ